MPDGQSIYLKGIGNELIINEFVILPIKLHGLNNQTVQLHDKVHIINTLYCSILIENNILKLYRMEIHWACTEVGKKDAL